MSGTRADVSRMLLGLRRRRERGVAAAVKAVDQFGEHVLGQAQSLTPIETGKLKDSAAADPAELKGNRITKTIGFNTDYAAAVHERLDLDHSKNKNPEGQAKFLEVPMKRAAPRLAEFVGERVRKAVES